jgi:catechol 2,3-dioxygenase-like lactoylglutathione lyase family enzyme
MTTHALYPVTMSADPQHTAAFYRELLELEPTFTSDWYVSLAAPGGDPQVATVRRDHDSVPPAFRAAPAGTLVTVEVDDAQAVRARATAMGAPVELELRDEPWGQRHFIARDPDGLLVDVIEPIAPSPEFAAQYTDAPPPA